jgi:membrane protein implicated in regulation of membrane protease activity
MMMLEESREPSEVPPFTAAQKVEILAIWLGEPVLFVMLARWLFHVSVAWYLLMLPWDVLGVLMVTHRSAALRLSRRFEDRMQRDMERLDKWKFIPFP